MEAAPAWTLPMQQQPAPAAAGADGGALTIRLLPVLQDNYVVALIRNGEAVVIDPAVGQPVLSWLEGQGLELVAILHTHHHSDHIGVAGELLRRWPQAAVIASAADRQRIPLQTRGVSEADRLDLLGHRLDVLEVPGHTRHHLAFLLHASRGDGGSGIAALQERVASDLFYGDTLFAGGCGRLFEGTAEQMHASLGRFAALPDAVRVWCAHEYTATNLAWAASERPHDTAIRERLQAVRRMRAAGLATIPSSIGLERATNLFLRAADAEELARLRQSRNHWRG